MKLFAPRVIAVAEEIDIDKIKSWEDLIEHCDNFQMPLLKTDAGITLLGVSSESPPVLLYSIFISKDFKVNCYKNSSFVPVRNLINGFTDKLDQHSQLDKIINHVPNSNPILETELRSVSER